MIVVAGEALIDLIGEGAGLRSYPGGGPFNTAVALGRLEVPVAFLGRLSEDHFGQLLDDRLAASGVERRYVLHSDAPTPLAVVHATSDDDHSFSFYLAGTAYADVTLADLPPLGPEVVALVVGTLALATDPPAAAFEALIEQESRRRLVVIDPNVRPAACGDREAYVRRFESWCERAHVLKLSDDDAAWLYPGAAPEAVVESALSHGTQLVVLTLGAHGALARTATAKASVPSPPIDVVDTVGAGDAFNAGLLRWLWLADRLNVDAVRRLGDTELGEALALATAVAALQCSHAGAVPPTLDEVDAFLASATDA